MRLNLPTPATALAIAAHPDDVEFQCGATMAKWAAAGTVIHHVICTDGSKGSWDADEDTALLVATRQEEQRAAARVLAGGMPGQQVFLDNVDGELPVDLERRAQVCRWIRELKPDVVLAHDPWKRWRLHPDHRAAGFLALDGIVAARDPHFNRELEIEHHRPSAVLLFESEAPDHAEDVTGYLDAKVAALLEHRSQFRTTHGIDDPEDEAQVARFRRHLDDQLAGAGARVGVRHAELFKLISRV